ncbi:hypothetical protein GCM10027038_34180 [Arthrobacter bambusae]
MAVAQDEGAQMTVAEAFKAISDDEARSHLERYFGLGEWTGNEYAGSHFDSFGVNGKVAFTSDDLISVSCLSVHVPAPAALGILGHRSAEITALLERIPNDVALQDIPLDEHDTYFGEDSPCLLLWRLLRAQDAQRWGVGATTASKLLARKRPALVPIYDSVVARVTGFKDSTGTWRAWHEAFATDVELPGRLEALRSTIGRNDLSLLRMLDIVLWMHGSQGAETLGNVDQDVS